MNGRFSREGIQKFNNPMKIYTISLVTRKMQIKRTMRNHFTPTRMSTGKEKWAITSIVQDIKKSELSYTDGGNVK